MLKQKTILQYLCLIIFTLSSISAFSQINIKIGYSLGYAQATNTNALISNFNANNSYETPLEELHFLHGVIVGLRYRVEDIAVHLDWNNKFNLLEGSGVSAADESLYERLYFKNSGFSLGLEFFATESLSFGGSLDLNALRYRRESDSVTTKTEIVTDTGLGSHFYISLNIEGTDILTLNLQPYVEIPWTSYDIGSLDSVINSVDHSNPLNAKYLNYGLRIIFSNGQW